MYPKCSLSTTKISVLGLYNTWNSEKVTVIQLVLLVRSYQAIVILDEMELSISSFDFQDNDTDTDSDDETLGDKLYNSFVARKRRYGLEIDNNYLIITKAESHDRILCILLGLGTFQIVLVFATYVLLVESVPQSTTLAFDKSNSGQN